jgi:hypothetical protein
LKVNHESQDATPSLDESNASLAASRGVIALFCTARNSCLTHVGKFACDD